MSAPLKNIPSSLSSAKPATRYRALCPLAVISLTLGILTVLTILADSIGAWILMTLLPIAGVVSGWFALKQIAAAPTEWIGLRLAKIGVGLSIGLWIACSLGGWLLYAGQIPAGYAQVKFEEIFGESNVVGRAIPQRVRDMQDKKVFIRGYMKPRRQMTGIKDFTLCPTSGDCPFCPTTTRGEMIRVMLPGDMTTDYTTHLIGVAGRFQIHEDDPSEIPFSIEADLLR